ncbi:energy transducer TonB [Actibacterium pelagium]|uniref:Cell envelope integrity/translocation protein TolA n=1 Tax=Actibacterium pelagium TaxID=2029103 RepID=A0A917ALB3_9RHOB|nr:energy transducer TonB [Actibacterium pelagium]GGE60318.1 cell envelope integrity/translocation protein TolA [Actibacterium pelagium]
MNTGVIISGLGHGLLILWLLFGGWFSRPEEAEFTTTEVSILSETEFLALTAPARAPSIVNEAPDVPAPNTELAALPPVPSDARPTPAPQPDQPTPPNPEDEPDVSRLTPAPPKEVADDLPDLPIPPAPEESANLIPDIGAPRPVARVAPTPSPAPTPELDRAPEVSKAPKPSEDAAEQLPEDKDAAPEEAAPEIVTEAEVTQKQGTAPASSIRPTARPARVAARPEPKPEQKPAPAPEPVSPPRDALADALAEALSGSGDAPTGPPLTFGERDALRVAVSRCWNVGSASTEALQTTVVVGVEMTPDGKPVQGSLRLISHSGGSEASARQMFEFARRAILRCGASGFDLPKEKYGRWRDIEMTFNPEKMRIR